MPVIRYLLRYVKQRLFPDVELGCQCELCAFRHTNSSTDVFKAVSDGQRCGREYATRYAREQALVQHLRHIDRTGFQKNAAPASLYPRNIVLQLTAAKDFQFAGEFACAMTQRFPLRRPIASFLQDLLRLLECADE